MLGSIAGDIIGSVFEWKRIKTKEFPLFIPDSTFTDDSVLTIAVACMSSKPFALFVMCDSAVCNVVDLAL